VSDEPAVQICGRKTTTGEQKNRLRKHLQVCCGAPNFAFATDTAHLEPTMWIASDLFASRIQRTAPDDKNQDPTVVLCGQLFRASTSKARGV
jgi:hypothetical protein